MKKNIFILVGMLIFCCACGNDDSAAAAQKTASETENIVPVSAPAAQDCELFAQNLSQCRRFSCPYTINMFGNEMINIYTVEGMEKGKCVFLQEAQSGGIKEEVMRCRMDGAQTEKAAKYFDTFFESDGNFSASVTIEGGNVTSKETIGGKAVENPLNGFLANGVCQWGDFGETPR